MDWPGLNPTNEGVANKGLHPIHNPANQDLCNWSVFKLVLGHVSYVLTSFLAAAILLRLFLFCNHLLWTYATKAKAPLRLARFSAPRRGRRYHWAARFNRFSWFSTKCCNWRGADPRQPAIPPRRSQESLWDRFFSRRAADLCACGQKFLTYGIPMPPWLSKTRSVPLAIIASIATEYRTRQCMTFRPHRLAIPRDRKSR